jgi:DNA-binding CsgD family transcriptional regulator
VLRDSDAGATTRTAALPIPHLPALTPREQEVFVLVCLHLQDREIAERLFVSPRTVESHVAHILGKLGVRSRRDAVALAARLGLVEGSGS